MKIEAKFETNIRRIYSILALPYPPKVPYQDSIIDQDDFEIEEMMLDVKPLKPKVQSYNINKDSLTNHKASKQLSKFLENIERKRREIEDKDSRKDSVNHMIYKENVVQFIETLSSKAKADRAEDDTQSAAQIKVQQNDILDDLRRFTHILEVDKNSNIEKERRLSECKDMNKRRETVHILNQMGPIHNQLTSAFKKAGSSEVLLRQMSSDDILTDSSDDYDMYRSTTIEKNATLKKIFNNDDTDEKEIGPSAQKMLKMVEQNLVPGSGTIGKTLKKCNRTFQDNLHQLADSTRRKTVMQQDLLRSLVKKDIKKTGMVRAGETKDHNKMEMVLDSVVHKVKAKEVEKEIASDQKIEKMKLAREDTLEKIKDYGRRKSVLENIDTSYTQLSHDKTSEKAHSKLMKTIGRNDSVISKNTSKRKASILQNGKPPQITDTTPYYATQQAHYNTRNKVSERPSQRRPTPIITTGKPPIKRAQTEKTIKFKGSPSSGGRKDSEQVSTTSRTPRTPGVSPRTPGTSPRSPKPGRQ